MTRYVSFISRLTGWNAIKSRVEQLGLEMTDDQIKEVYVSYPETRPSVLVARTDRDILTARPRSRLWQIFVPLLLMTVMRSSSVSFPLPSLQ